MVFNETELIQVLSGADIRKELRDNAVSLRWATVTNLMPLEVQRDGEFESFAVTGSAVDASLLEVNDRVRVSNFGSKAFIESSQNTLTRFSARLSSRIPAGSNFNNYTTPGRYYSPSNADVTTMLNSPYGSSAGVAGALDVLEAAGVVQYWHEYNTGLNSRVWRRRFYLGAWSAWEVVYAPPEDTGWVSLTIETNAGSAYGTPGVRRINGIVYLRGGVGNDAGIPNTKLCDLPAGFLPATTMFMSAGAADAPGQTVGIYSGAIIKRSSGANPRFLHFDGLSYPTT